MRGLFSRDGELKDEKNQGVLPQAEVQRQQEELVLVWQVEKEGEEGTKARQDHKQQEELRLVAQP